MNQISGAHKMFDNIIIGGGVMGLWAARHAVARSESVLLLEKGKVGCGASGGFLGALMPHMPDGWDEKKAFQYQGLSTLGEVVAELEAETGIDCGYKQCGRIMPMVHEAMRNHETIRTEGARKFWDDPFKLEMIESEFYRSYMSDWMDIDLAEFGVQVDTLSARINPRAYVTALMASLKDKIEVREKTNVIQFASYGADGASVTMDDNEVISAGRVIVANGWEAYEQLQPFMSDMNNGRSIGRGVKGQAVLVEHEHNDDLPIVYHDGVFVVPHKGNRVAIGSTSISDWQDEPNPSPSSFDLKNMGFYHAALKFVPALGDSQIIERWAAVRPRNTIGGRGTDPYFAPVPDCPSIFALIGGFKVTLGIAHLDHVSHPYPREV